MGTQTRAVVAIVDVYTCSEFLLAAFSALELDVVQVRWRPEVSPAIKDLPYRATVVGSDREVLAAELARYAPIAIVAGQEPDVPIADFLSERFGLASNGTVLSSARRNKFEMTEALRRTGVRCVDQLVADNVEAVVDWARSRGSYPVVVKPLTSAGTDGVAVCADAAQVRSAAQAILGSSTIFDEPNDRVLIQAFLDGLEYVVDTVSCEGQRYTCGVWEYRKRLVGVHNVYDREIAVPADAGVVHELVDYVDEVLQALDIRSGPSHAEVILTTEGPTLVEVGARTAGNMHPEFHDRCLGGNQAALTALAYAQPHEFLAHHAGGCYRRLLDASVYTTPTDLDGVVARINRDVIREIHGLATVWGVILKVGEGSRIKPTIDLKSSTMKVLMAGTNESDVLRDYHRVRALKDDVFHIA